MITTLKARLSALATLTLLLTAPIASNATTLVLENRGLIAPVVVGARGVNVNGAIYDLTFISRQSMTCADSFSGCDDIDDFPFGVNFPNNPIDANELGEIVAATAALQEQVLPLIQSSQFVEGCLTGGNRVCILQIPYTINNTGSGPATVFTSHIEFIAFSTSLNVRDTSILFETPATLLTESPSVGSFVRFDLVTPSPVPVPAAVWLMGSALVGLLGVARRRRG